MIRNLGCARRQSDARFGDLLNVFRFGLVAFTVFLTAGCATIAPRNVLPQANAEQIGLDGFHDIRFWGDASAHDIRAIMMADEACWSAGAMPARGRCSIWSQASGQAL